MVTENCLSNRRLKILVARPHRFRETLPRRPKPWREIEAARAVVPIRLSTPRAYLGKLEQTSCPDRDQCRAGSMRQNKRRRQERPDQKSRAARFGRRTKILS